MKRRRPVASGAIGPGRATVLGVGLIVGALVVARIVNAPLLLTLLVYAVLEVGIGVFGLLALWLLPVVGGLYTSIGGPGTMGIVIRP